MPLVLSSIFFSQRILPSKTLPIGPDIHPFVEESDSLYPRQDQPVLLVSITSRNQNIQVYPTIGCKRLFPDGKTIMRQGAARRVLLSEGHLQCVFLL